MQGNAFDRFLDWFDKYKYALIGTLMLHLLVIGGLSVWQVRQVPKEEDKRQLLVDVIDEETMQELLAEQQLQQLQELTGRVRNFTNDASGELTEEVRPASFRRMSSRATEELVEEELRQLEAGEFQRLAEERTERGEDVDMPELDKSKWNPANYMAASKPVRITGRTTTTFYLEGRGASIPTPAYLCEGSGIVKVNIQVDRSGRVKGVAVDANSTGDQCMIDAALEFVGRSSFEPKSAAPNSQSGWVQFAFVAQ